MTDIPAKLPESSPEEAAAAIERVSKKKEEWAKLGAARKLELLRAIIENLKTEYNTWAKTACLSHGYDSSDPNQAHLLGETYVKGPAISANWLRAVEALYESLASTGKPPAPGPSSKRSDGSFAVKVWPLNVLDTIFSGGASAVIYTAKGSDPSQFNPLELPSGVAGLLGAGNFDAFNDVLDAMYLCNKVVVFKPNPVNDRSAVCTHRVLRPLIDEGYLAYVVGGIPIGTLVVQSPLVDELVMTGSCNTYDAIVWGPGAKKPKPDEKNPSVKKLVDKPFKAELGSVNPYIVVPGEWSAKELQAQAEQLASFKMMNNAHICASPQVIVTCKQWKQRNQFLAAVRKALAAWPATRPYYPNCDKSYAEQVKELTKATGLADEKQPPSAKATADLMVKNTALFPGQQHPVFATDVPQDAFVTRKEAFCPILAEVPLDTEPNCDAFLPVAVDYANKQVWGSLTCTLIVDSRAEKASATVIEKAIDDLQFGAIGVNQWAGFCVLYGQLLWGAYPRHTPEDVQSGIGKMGNTLCLKDPVKCVLRFPFYHPAMQKVPPSPQAALLQSQRLTEYLIHYNFYRLTKLLVNALTGF